MQRQLVLWFMDDCQSENSELFVGDDQGGLAGAERSYRQLIDRAAYLSNPLPRGHVPYHRPAVATAADHPPIRQRRHGPYLVAVAEFDWAGAGCGRVPDH